MQKDEWMKTARLFCDSYTANKTVKNFAKFTAKWYLTHCHG